MSLVAMISGGCGDIGYAIARTLEAQSTSVSVADLKGRVGFEPALMMFGDVSERSFVQEWLAKTESRLGTPSIVIVNAGVVVSGSVLGADSADWDRQIQVNLSGAFHLAQLSAKSMIKSQVQGRILFIGSWAADRPDAEIAAYCASKAAMRMLMRCLAKEVAPHGILVNEVAPGIVDAGVSAQVFRERTGSRQAFEARIPTGKMLTPQDVADAVTFLCDPVNVHMTGSVLTVDGGCSL